MIASYQDALKYLYENLPMFQRVGAVAIKKDLGNTLKLCKALGDPHLAFKSVHVAGTNGKGSTCHVLASILQEAGYKTGLYTSPHLKAFTERIRVNGEEISRQYVTDFVNRMIPVIEAIRPSFFEITVAMAFDYFAAVNVDVAVIEVGLGGRLDSTNVITPVVSVITNISFDHTEILGNTLSEIASQKAGIIKKGIPVVISERQPEVEAVFTGAAQEAGSQICFASDTYGVIAKPDRGAIDILRQGNIVLDNVQFPLRGIYQRHNIPGIMSTIDVLEKGFVIAPVHVRRGFEHVVSNTGLKGRWQKISFNPTVVCDTAHNVAGVREVLQQLQEEAYDRLFIVWGMVKDKVPEGVLRLLPRDAIYFFCQANIPRAMDAEALAESAQYFGLRGTVVRDVNEAKAAALAMAGPRDLIYIGGSTYVVSEVKEL